MSVKLRVFCLMSAVLAVCATAHAQLVDAFDPGASGVIYAMALQPDGKILVGGQFSRLGGGGTGVTTRSLIARLNPDGSLDASFNPVVCCSAVVTIAVQPDGKILVGGDFTQAAGVVRNNIARLNPDGSLDAGFNPGSSGGIFGTSEVDVIAVQPDGKILVGGEFTRLGGGTGTTIRNRIGRLNADGSVDSTFNPSANDAVISLAVQPNGQIVVGGVFTTLGGAMRNRIARLNANGTLDATFNPGTSGNVVTAVALQADGKILLGGNFSGLGGVTGTTPRSRIGRLNADGSVDGGFDPGATGSIVYTIGVQADAKILVGGTFTTLGNGATTPRRNIGRLNPDGSPDMSFDPGANASVYGVLLQSDGLVLVGGSFTGLGGTTGTTPRSRIGRLTNDAAIQNLSLNDSRNAVIWMRSGTSPEVTRVTFDWSMSGVTYTPLGSGTRVAGGWQLTGQSFPNRDLYLRARGYVATGYENASGSIVESITLQKARVATGDFDGDGKAEIGVFRRSTGTWYIRYTGTPTALDVVWGGGSDIPVVADYDGDGKTDVAVFRPSTGTWYIRYTATPTAFDIIWGGGSDIPVVADYDGDGKADIAVFRPSTGTWYIRYTATPTAFDIVWGGGSDIPVVADYDGDGKADIAVFRPSTGTWYIRYTATPTALDVIWGGGTDIPVVADYDGDGKADIAVFRQSTGTWYIRYTATPTALDVIWGGGTDIPVSADYDGDGKADIAVFRPSTGTWYIRYTATPTAFDVIWGGGSDIPVLQQP